MVGQATNPHLLYLLDCRGHSWWLDFTTFVSSFCVCLQRWASPTAALYLTSYDDWTMYKAQRGFALVAHPSMRRCLMKPSGNNGIPVLAPPAMTTERQPTPHHMAVVFVCPEVVQALTAGKTNLVALHPMLKGLHGVPVNISHTSYAKGFVTGGPNSMYHGREAAEKGRGGVSWRVL